MELRSFFAASCLFWCSAIALAGECDTPRTTWLLCDDFESGNFSKWTAVYDPSVIQIASQPQDSAVVNAPLPATRGGTKAARFHYVVGAGGADHQDDNRMLFLNLGTQRTDHLFVRGYVLIPGNTSLFGATRQIQRKLIYFKSNPDPASGSNERSPIGFALTSDVESPSADYISVRLGYGGGGGMGASIHNLARLQKGRWHVIQVEVKLNTPSDSNGVYADGVFRLWVNDVLAYENTRMDYRSNVASAPSASDQGQSGAYLLERIEIGRQVDRTNWDPVDEYRYWDNIVVSRDFVPTKAPSPPTNVQLR